MFKRASFSILSISLLAASFAAGGCASTDSHSFTSTKVRPTSVSVLRGEGEVIWHMDVPVNHRLDLKFNRRDEAELFATTGRLADHMLWSLYDLNPEYDAFIDHGTRRVGYGDVEINNERVRMVVRYREPGHPGDPQPKSNVIGEDARTEQQAPLPAETSGSEQSADEQMSGEQAAGEAPMDAQTTQEAPVDEQAATFESTDGQPAGEQSSDGQGEPMK